MPCPTTTIPRSRRRMRNVCSRIGRRRPPSCSRFPAAPIPIALMWLAARWRRALARGPRLVAVTVDHGLRTEAAREARDVKRLARSLGLPHRTLRWTRRQTENRIAGRGAGRALPSAGAGGAAPRRHSYPYRAYPRRSGRDAVDAPVARQRHRRSRGDGEAIRRAMACVLARPLAGCFESAADRDAGESKGRLCRRSDQPRHSVSRGRGCGR